VPDLSTLLLFMAAAGIVVAIPGPNHLYIITRSVSQDRSAGLASAAGIETGTLVHIAAAALGLSSIIASSALAFSMIKYAGAAYLIYLGLRTVLRRPKPLDQQIESRSADPLWKVYREGIVVNVLNPKVALFFLAFLPQFIDTNSELAAVQIIVLGLVMSLMGMASDIVYALSGGALRNLLERRPRFSQAQRYVTGTVYVGLGAAAALAGETRR
jgi:threonine/homoserine/homoserine lactone efflux protein